MITLSRFSMTIGILLIFVLLCMTAGMVIADDEKDEMTASEKIFGKKSEKKSLLHRVVFYIPNRALDLIDCVRANVGLGFGIGGNVRATEALQVGAAVYHTARFGLSNERLNIIYHEFSVESGLGPAYARVSNNTRDFMEVGATLHLGVVGVDAAINLDEIMDFIGGVFFCDFQGDDL